jgi:UDP-N-acetylmuramate dehydrogenase
LSGLFDSLEETGVPVLADEPLAGYTGLKVGGPADLFVKPRNAEEVAMALRLAGENRTPVLVMGRGTNLLVSDGGFRGLVVLVGGDFGGNEVLIHDSRCITTAGVRLHLLIERLSDAGLAGLEDLYGIPGSLGGALAMNAGAYGTEIWPRVGWVEIVLASGETRRRTGDEIEYGYRRADLPTGAAITRAELTLREGNPHELRRRCLERWADREKKHPLEWPNCGSVFKNFSWEPGMDLRYSRLAEALGEDFSKEALEEGGPQPLPAWRLVDACGLTGRKMGGAQISTKHSNFMINLGGARASDFAALIELARKAVEETFGIGLQTEVRLLGEF